MPALLVVCFLVVPLAEIYVILQVGHAIGGWQTFALLVFESLLGGWIVKREGVRAWRSLRGALAGGGVPSRELLDGALVLVGGTLLLAPGFLTDILGFFLVVPFTRPLARRGLLAFAKRYFVVVAPGATGTGMPPFRAGTRPPDHAGPGGKNGSGDVIQGEVVDDD